jgi:hypothetical protein
LNRDVERLQRIYDGEIRGDGSQCFEEHRENQDKRGMARSSHEMEIDERKGVVGTGVDKHGAGQRRKDSKESGSIGTRDQSNERDSVAHGGEQLV